MTVALNMLWHVVSSFCRHDFFTCIMLTTMMSFADKSGWQGGKHLASSATFTTEFCQAVLTAWLKARERMQLNV